MSYYIIAAKTYGNPPSYPWMLEAFSRTVILSSLRMSRNLRGAGTIMEHCILAPGVFATETGPDTSIVVEPKVPQDITLSEVQAFGGYRQHLQLCLILADCPVKMPKPRIIGCPQEGEDLFLISARAGLLTVRVMRLCEEEEDDELLDTLMSKDIETRSGIPGSLLYNKRGQVAGVAVDAYPQGGLIVFPGWVLERYYHNVLPLFKKLLPTNEEDN